MKIKCRIFDLETLCKLVSLKGKNIDGKDYRAILDCLIDAKYTNKLRVQAMDIQGTFAIHLDYNVDIVEQEGPLAIRDIEEFEGFLQRFNPDDLVTLYTDGNKIVIERDSPKKTARIPLADIASIASKEAPPIEKLEFSQYGYPKSSKVHYNLSMVINAEAITNIFEDGNVIKQRILPWKIKDNKLSVSIGSEQQGSFETEVALEELQNDPEKPGQKQTMTAFGNGLHNIFSNLTGKVKIYLMDESTEVHPLAVSQDTAKYKFFALLAPYAEVKD